MNFISRCLLFLLLAAFLSGCTLSQEDMTEQTIKNVKEVFSGNPPKADQKAGSYRFYLPETYKIDAVRKYNILLLENSQRTILFINQNEKPSSTVAYETIKRQYKHRVLDVQMKDKNRFGYAAADKLKNNRYEITVGIGGIKLTTEADASKIPDSAKKMMMIAASLQRNP